MATRCQALPAVRKRWRDECSDDEYIDVPDEEEDEEDDDEFATRLARWCRSQMRDGGSAGEACRAALAHCSGSRCPRRLIGQLAASDAGRTFLLSQAAELRKDAPATRVGRRQRHRALGSIFEAAGDLRVAERHLRAALAVEGVTLTPPTPASTPSRPPLSPLTESGDRDGGSRDGDEEADSGRLRAALRVVSADRHAPPRAMRALLSSLIRVRRQISANEWSDAAAAMPAPASAKPVPRAPAGLSVAEFERHFAATGTPCVIPLPPTAGPQGDTPWDLSHLRERLGGMRAELKRRQDDSVQWAGLEPCSGAEGGMRVDEFIDAALASDRSARAASDASSSAGEALSAMDDEEPAYLFDWSLPQHCPAMLEEFVVPRYFAGDLLQRAPPGSLLREAWPSLFIGPRGSRCALHVDAYGTHFWMLVLDGRKAWTIFPRGATALLRPSFAHGHDASFAEDVNAAEDATPGCKTSSSTADWRCLERWACELTSGELLFVPAGCAHAVSNLTATAAISANFVSQSNRQLAIDELSVAGLQAPPAADLAHHLAGLPSSNCLEQDVPWESFKVKQEVQ